MTWIECPACRKPRSVTTVTSDGEVVSFCAHCDDPGWVNPWPLTGDPTDGRPRDH